MVSRIKCRCRFLLCYILKNVLWWSVRWKTTSKHEMYLFLKMLLKTWISTHNFWWSGVFWSSCHFNFFTGSSIHKLKEKLEKLFSKPKTTRVTFVYVKWWDLLSIDWLLSETSALTLAGNYFKWQVSQKIGILNR